MYISFQALNGNCADHVTQEMMGERRGEEENVKKNK
jgi:hypothetical protein